MSEKNAKKKARNAIKKQVAENAAKKAEQRVKQIQEMAHRPTPEIPTLSTNIDEAIIACFMKKIIRNPTPSQIANAIAAFNQLKNKPNEQPPMENWRGSHIFKGHPNWLVAKSLIK